MLSTIQSSQTITTTAAPPASGGNLGLTSGSDFSTFLKMLTTQMQNQNPLDPVEAADFAVQLATFSGVEQQVQTNQLLARLTERMLSADLSNWLGADVAVQGDIRIGDSSIFLDLPSPVVGTARRDIVLTTTGGQEVMRMPLRRDQQQFVLDPSIDGVAPLLPGAYRAQVQDFSDTDLLETRSALQFAEVKEVQRGPDGILLMLASGAQIDPDAVVAIRRP